MYIVVATVGSTTNPVTTGASQNVATTVAPGDVNNNQGAESDTGLNGAGVMNGTSTTGIIVAVGSVCALFVILGLVLYVRKRSSTSAPNATGTQMKQLGVTKV